MYMQTQAFTWIQIHTCLVPSRVSQSTAFAGFASLFASIMTAVGATERVYQILDRTPLLDNTAGALISAESLRGEVEFRGVSFSYPTRPDAAVLSGASFRIQPGTVAAIVGCVRAAAAIRTFACSISTLVGVLQAQRRR